MTMERAKSGFVGVLDLMGKLAGIIALLAVVALGGELKRQVELDALAITEIRNGGSVALVSHTRDDDRRDLDIQRRLEMDELKLEKLDDAVNQQGKILETLKTIDYRLGEIEKRLKP